MHFKIADLSNAEWLKYDGSNLYCDVPQRILDRDRTVRVVVPVDYQGTLKMQDTSCLPLEPYLWRQHSSANSSPRQRRPDNVAVEL